MQGTLLLSSQVRERELQDNMELLDKQAELQEVDRELRALRQELRRSGLDQYEG